MSYIKKIKCLIKQMNNILNHNVSLDFDPTDNKLKAFFANGKSDEAELSFVVPEYTLSNVNGSNEFDLLKDGIPVSQIDLTPYLDDTNLARIVSGVVHPTTGIATITRDDATTFTIDFSSLIDTQPTKVSELENDVPYVKVGERITDSTVVGTYDLDHDLATDWKLTLTGNTTFTESNLPLGINTTEFTMKLTGAFIPTFPTYWDVLGDAYDGSKWNFIAVQVHDGNSSTEETTAFITNIG